MVAQLAEPALPPSPHAPLADELITLASPGVVALIPAHNEERFIGSIVLAALTHVDAVIVIDDGSSDRTAEIARRAGATVIQHQSNQGKAAAVNTGFRYLRAHQPAAVVMLDGDGQHRADDIPAVLGPIVAGEADIVVGSRFLELRSAIPAYRQVGQHSLTLATNLASGVSLSDSQSGYRAFSGRALRLLSFSREGFSIESEMQFLAGEHGLRMREVPIQVIYRERAKRNPFSHGMQVLHAILQLVGQARPLLFCSLIALPLLLGGLLFGLLVLDAYRQTRQLAVGYALLTILLSEIGMLLLFAGIILHSTRGLLLALQRNLVEQIAGLHAQL